MMKPKQVLFFSSTNPAGIGSVQHTRILSLLMYFKRMGLMTDFLSIQSPVEFTICNKTRLTSLGLFRNLYLLVKNPKRKYPAGYFLTYEFLRFCLTKLLKIPVKDESLQGLANYDYRRQFNALLSKTAYDYIFLTDERWSGLISGKSPAGKPVKILLADDFLNAESFDQAWISGEPDLSPNTGVVRVLNLPAMVDIPEPEVSKVKDLDILYIDSGEQGNKEAMDWFFSEVYPLIRGRVSMLVIGNALENIPPDLSEIEMVSHAEDLGSYYRRAKILICPMFPPAELKMRIAQAQAYSLPVICSQRMAINPNPFSKGACTQAQQPHEFARAILELLENPAFYESRSQEAFYWFLAYHESCRLYERLNEALTLNPELSD